MLPTFQWTTFEVNGLLSPGWQEEIAPIAMNADFRDFPRTPGLTREAPSVRVIPRGRVHAAAVKKSLGWLYGLYRDGFRQLAERVAGEPVVPAGDDRYGVVLNVQHGPAMRFECHLDSNPLTGLLFCSDHPVGAGGELVFAQDSSAASVEEIERSSAVIRPHAGHLIFFDGRNHPHYVRALRAQADLRVVAVMNYYTRSFPESTRPPELNRHLYGDR